MLHTKVSMKELSRGKKRPQQKSLICPLEFQPQRDEAFTVDGRKHTHTHRHTHTHTHTKVAKKTRKPVTSGIRNKGEKIRVTGSLEY